MSKLKAMFKKEDFIMPFGKYKGQNLLRISVDNPGYIVWLHDENVFQVEAKLLGVCRDAILEPDTELFHGDYGNRD